MGQPFAEHESTAVTSHPPGADIAWKHIMNNGVVLALLAACASSSKSVFIKLFYAEAAVSPLTAMALRLILASPFFVLLAIYPRKHNSAAPTPHKTKDRANSLLGSTALLTIWLGFCGYYFAGLSNFTGLTYISAGLERLVLFSYPILVVMIEAVWQRRRPSPTLLKGAAICYCGLLAAFVHDVSQNSNSQQIVTGVAYVLLSGFAFALYYLGAGKAVKSLGAKRLTGLAGLSACLMMLCHFYLYGDFGELTQLSWASWMLMGIIAIPCTVLPALLLTAAIDRIGPSTTANIATIGPMVTITLGWWVLGEAFSLLQLSGMAMVILGIRVVQQSVKADH